MAGRSYASDPTHGRPKGSKGKPSLAAFEEVDRVNEVSWNNVEATGIMEVVTLVTDMGGAVILGRTRDGGAYSITLILADDKRRFYAGSPLELAAAVQRIVNGLSNDR